MVTKNVKEITVIQDEELRKIIKERLEYKRIKEEAEQIIKSLDEKIKAALESAGDTTIICGEHKVSLSKFIRETVSAKEVKKFVSDEVFEQVVSRTETERLTIK